MNTVITEAQRAVLVALTDQRCANLLASADFIADLPETTKSFLRDADPATMMFLKGARPEEINNLKDGIRLVVASRLIGKATRWTILTFFGTMFGVLALWDKLVTLFQVKGLK